MMIAASVINSKCQCDKRARLDLWPKAQVLWRCRTEKISSILLLPGDCIFANSPGLFLCAAQMFRTLKHYFDVQEFDLLQPTILITCKNLKWDYNCSKGRQYQVTYNIVQEEITNEAAYTCA